MSKIRRDIRVDALTATENVCPHVAYIYLTTLWLLQLHLLIM